MSPRNAAIETIPTCVASPLPRLSSARLAYSRCPDLDLTTAFGDHRARVSPGSYDGRMLFTSSRSAAAAHGINVDTVHFGLYEPNNAEPQDKS